MNNQFIKDLKYLESLSMEEENPEELIKIECTIEILNSLAYQYSSTEKQSTKLSTKKMLELELVYYLQNKKILELLLGTLDSKILENEPDYRSIISQEELVSFNYDFFKSICTKVMLEKLDEFYQNKKFLLHINPVITPNPTGSTIHLWYFNESHIFMDRTSHIEDIATLAHETGHTLENLINYNLSFFDDKYVFMEIISSICEILSLVHAIKIGFHKEDAITNLKSRINDFLVRNKCCLMEAELLKRYTENIQNLSLRTLKKDTKEISKKFDFEDGSLYYKSLLSPFISQYLHYNLGFLLGINLAIKFMENEEEVPFIIDKLIHLNSSLPYNEYLTELLNVVNPNFNLEKLKHLCL